jgi:hypothetical protein
VYSITCVDPACVSQTTIAVTILHNIHYSIEVPKTKKRIIGFQNILGFFIITHIVLQPWWWWWWRRHVRGFVSTWLFWRSVDHHNLGHVCYRKWRLRKWRHQKWRERKWPELTLTGSDVTGKDVIFPRVFLTKVVMQNVPYTNN